MVDNARVRLTRTERAVAAAFATGARLDLRDWPDRGVRAKALRFILLGGAQARPGELAALHLTGADVTGELELDSADVAPIALERCTFDQPTILFGARLPRISFVGSRLTSLNAGNAVIDGSLVLRGSTCDGLVSLGGATVGGSVLMSRAVLAGPGISLDATSLRVRRDVIADDGFTCHGAIRLDRCDIGGVLSLEGAVLNGSGAAVTPQWRATTEVAAGAFDERVWAVSVALSGRDLGVRELVLLPRQPPGGLIDLRHARLGTLRDDRKTWPPRLHLDGLSYEGLAPADDCPTRLAWLRLEDDFRPQPYAQLARLYRAAGRDDDARTVLLAGERRRRGKLGWPGRWWSRLQDLTVGYGYRPLRAAGWMALLFAVGAVVFSLHPPRAVEPAKAPALLEPIYALDVILPVDLGQQSAYRPLGPTVWLAYALNAAGLVLTTTVAAAAARHLRRT
jgi:hypothetical protein